MFCTSQPRITVVSGHTNPHLGLPINHDVYCRRHGYTYLYDVNPRPLKLVFDHKIHAILRALDDPRTDWVLWIDDDAFFAQLDTPLTDIKGQDVEAPWGGGCQPEDQKRPLVERPELAHFSRSPVNPQGMWSAINSGIMWLRRDPAIIDLMEEVLETDIDQVRAWWNPDTNGNLFVDDGDQERIQYLLVQKNWGARAALHDPLVFNSRPYHLKDRVDELFICHLASARDKVQGVAEIRQRFGLDEFGLPPGALDDPASYRFSLFASMIPKRTMMPDC